MRCGIGSLTDRQPLVLIANDHPILRRGLKEILVRDLEGVECGEAKDVQEVLDQVRSHHWDLLLLDVAMAGRSGLDILKDLKREQRRLPVLVSSMVSGDDYGMRMLKAGASGYITKQSTPEELIQAIQKVMAGGRYVSPALAEKLALDLGGETERPLHERLSDRELQVLRMLSLGKTISQLARELHLSVATVSTYRARLLQKMGMRTNAELMRYALRNRLID